MNISAEELKTKMDKGGDFILIDVREPYEHEESCIASARNIPLAEITAAIPSLESFRDKEIILHCRSGNRSATAQAVLLKSGFSRVLNLTGGIIAWKKMTGE